VTTEFFQDVLIGFGLGRLANEEKVILEVSIFTRAVVKRPHAEDKHEAFFPALSFGVYCV
jgi:hypothetical protein